MELHHLQTNRFGSVLAIPNVWVALDEAFGVCDWDWFLLPRDTGSNGFDPCFFKLRRKLLR